MRWILKARSLAIADLVIGMGKNSFSAGLFLINANYEG